MFYAAAKFFRIASQKSLSVEVTWTPHLLSERLEKIGTHCVHVGNASAERFSASVGKHYIHEIDALVSLDRVECFALKKKNTQKQLHSSSKIVSL